MSDTLSRILADKREHVARRKERHPLAEIESVAYVAEPPRGFARALAAAQADGRYALIAEIKRASPSRGIIREDFEPAELARAYAAGGATCLSVLTDKPWFQGEDAFLRAAHAAVTLPVLRKDFMIDPYQAVEARAIGADCILLIMAALPLELAREIEAAAFSLGMDVLVEVHDAAELERALTLETRLIGINNRDLSTLNVDLNRTAELAPLVPEGYLIVGESGLKTSRDLDQLAECGVRAFLVGESLMSEADVADATRRLLAR
jgi:indole-3-glycerol phosphate synthase